jgi:uncharacterized protein (TIGR03083 family)
VPVDLEADPGQAIGLCRAAHARLMVTVAGVTDEQARSPSRLPGWTIGHVLTHLARNADGHARRLDGALRGADVPRYPGGSAQRSAGIDAGAPRPAADIIADLAAAGSRDAPRWTWDWATSPGTGRGQDPKEALRALKRQVSNALYQKMKADARRAAASTGPEGTRGTAVPPAWPACTLQTGSSAKPLPDLTPPYDPGPARPRPGARAAPGGPGGRLPRTPAPSPGLPGQPRAGLRAARRRGQALACAEESIYGTRALMSLTFLIMPMGA